MASKTISVTEEVYEILRKEKLPGESFSQTLKRLVTNRGKLVDCAGGWSDMSEEDLAAVTRGMAEVRRSANRRVLHQ